MQEHIALTHGTWEGVWYKRGIGTIGSRSDYGNAEVTRKAKGFWDSDSDDEAQAIEPVARGP